MTNEEPLHYRAKHPAGTPPDASIAAALEQSAPGGRITCAEAYAVVRRLGVTPEDLGKTADLLEYRIITCQLGLFGYSPEKKIVKAAEEVSAELRDQIDEAATDGQIECEAMWAVAEALSLEKMVVAAACEGLGLKIVRCPLGAF